MLVKLKQLGATCQRLVNVADTGDNGLFACNNRVALVAAGAPLAEGVHAMDTDR